MKTTKQIADALEVPKQQVYRFIKKNCIIEANQEAGVKYYDEAVIEQITEHFKKATASEEVHQEQIESIPEAHQETLLETLQNQLAVKDGQIADLQQTIMKLTDTLNTQAQSLNAVNHRELAETVQDKGFLEAPPIPQAKPQKRWYEVWKRG